MSTNTKNSTDGNYYSGGFAEFVSSPSILTYSFMADWFTGIGSLGKAMKLIQMPYEEVNLSVLDLRDGELLVDLDKEEKTFYKKTIFKYKQQIDIHNTPTLFIDFKKVINPFCLINTLKILLTQSKWIANPQLVIKNAQKLVNDIPNEKKGKNIEEIDELLKYKVWPNVIAVGMLSEFYNQFLIKEAKENIQEINKYISHMMAKDDWYFLSIADQKEVKNDRMLFAKYIEKYGLRADKDYEITSPRWWEMQEELKERIEASSDEIVNQNTDLKVDKKIHMIIDASIRLQLLRSESKRKTLVHINNLREVILQKVGVENDIRKIKKEQLLSGNFPKILNPKKNIRNEKINHLSVGSSKGISVSQGQATGITKNIIDNEIDIPEGTIGIFPNASPEFAIQFPKCSGMIFLKGGQTSHGAIVAREFGIPAVIDSKAGGINDNLKLELNGTTGDWKLI